MGYRDSRTWRNQQKQQQFAESVSSEQRAFLPAPRSINHNSNRLNMRPDEATFMEGLIHTDGGIDVQGQSKGLTAITNQNPSTPISLIQYDGSGTASAEFWAIGKSGTQIVIYSASEIIASASADFVTASGTTMTFSAAGNPAYDYTELGNSVIATNGKDPIRWDRANGWQQWSATASGDSIRTMLGVTSFKQRLYAWQEDSPKFWYGSTGQVIGTLNPFDLSDVVSGNIRCVFGMNRDFSGGPDELATFVTDTGDAAVYQGNDPGDANNWSLVGIYKIGEPVSTNAHIKYGRSVVVLCTDDFYFLPEDLLGKKQSTPGARYRKPDDLYKNSLNATFWREGGLLVFGDGSTLNTKDNLAYTDIALTSASPYYLRDRQIEKTDSGVTGTLTYPQVGIYDGVLYAAGKRLDNSVGTLQNAIFKCISDQQRRRARIISSPINTSGRTNISLINPIFNFRIRRDVTATASVSAGLIYRVAIVYDQIDQDFVEASAGAWITTTCSARSNGIWTPAFGTGDWAQVHLEVLDGTQPQFGNFIFQGIDITVSDTGGL